MIETIYYEGVEYKIEIAYEDFYETIFDVNGKRFVYPNDECRDNNGKVRPGYLVGMVEKFLDI